MIRGWHLAALFTATLLIACSDDGSTTSSSSSGQGGSAGQGGGSGGAGGAGGSGGTGGMAPNFGPPSSGFVNAGEVSKSPSYRLVWTMGQSTTNQSKTSSAGYRLQGGLIGANGSVP